MTGCPAPDPWRDAAWGHAHPRTVNGALSLEASLGRHGGERHARERGLGRNGHFPPYSPPALAPTAVWTCGPGGKCGVVVPRMADRPWRLGLMHHHRAKDSPFFSALLWCQYSTPLRLRSAQGPCVQTRSLLPLEPTEETPFSLSGPS